MPYVCELLVEGFNISEDLSIHGQGSGLVGVEKSAQVTLIIVIMP